MHSSTIPLFFIFFGALSSCTPVENHGSTLASSAVPISKTIMSLSIEFCYITDYLGDINKPNTLSTRLLQNIQDLAGQPPIIRIGGHTQDATRYCSNCTDTLTNVFKPGSTEAVNVTYNRNLFSVLNQNVPTNQKIIFGLDLGQNDEKFPEAEVAAAEKYFLPSRILSYELGNEPDFFSASQRPRPWNILLYTTQIIDWITTIQKSTKTKRGWQVGAFAQLPVYQGNFSLPELNVLGVPKKIQPLTAYSDHTYPYSICDAARAKLVSLVGLMNHTTTLSFFNQWLPSIQAAKDANTLFHMGETGSVSCHGKPGVSNTQGAALWQLDYVLNGAVIGMDGVFFHMGTPFFYSMWQPVDYNGTAPKVYPTYNALVVMASVFSNLRSPYISRVPSPLELPNMAIYALYPCKPESAQITPTKLILLNLNYYGSNSTTARPVDEIDASSILNSKNLKVTRLTAAGGDSVTGATFGGQNWEEAGVVSGKAVYETAKGGVVGVGDSEGVVVEVI